MHSVAHFETDSAHRYLEALCQHFGRKVEVQCFNDQGWVQFAFGRCGMKAEATRLEMTAKAEDADDLDLVVDTVTRHLERYAFRENPRLDWHTSNDADTPIKKQGS